MTLSERFGKAKDAVPGLTNREIARQAGVSPPTVDRMMRGEGQPELDNVDAVARVLKVPVREARKLAGFPQTVNDHYTGPNESRLLTLRQRKAIDELIKSIVQSVDKSKDGTGLTRIDRKLKRKHLGVEEPDERDEKRG